MAQDYFVLIHSPLVGPFTWSFTTQELKKRGQNVIAPHLVDSDDSPAPYWLQEARSAAQAIADAAQDAPNLILVAHSGTGPLLPAIRAALGRSVSGYLFVDAGLPDPGKTRLELIQEESVELGQQFEELLKSGGRYPDWSSDDLRDIVPNDTVRHELIMSIRPRGADFFNETLPGFPGWPDAPCGYILFSEGYRWAYQQAAERGWATKELTGGHFHMLVEPAQVAQAILEVSSHFD